jgi:hypothetical protein
MGLASDQKRSVKPDHFIVWHPDWHPKAEADPVPGMMIAG